MTDTERDVLGAKLDALKDSIDQWHKVSCAEHARRLITVEDLTRKQGLKIASGGRIAFAAFLGALLPALAVMVAAIELMRKIAALANGGG